METKKQKAIARGKADKKKKFDQKKFDKVKSQVFKTATPVYKSGFMNGKPMNYNTAKKGVITSID